MREERGQVDGDAVIYEPFTLWGAVGGSVRVIDGGKFYLRGTVVGDVIVEDGGRMHVYGNIAGSLRLQSGAKVIHSGLVGGDVSNDGGRLFIEAIARVNGRVRTTSEGETKIEPRKIPLDSIES